MWYIHPMEYYLAIKTERDTDEGYNMNLANVVTSERSRSQMTTYCVIALKQCPGRQIQRDRKEIGGCLIEAGVGRIGYDGWWLRAVGKFGGGDNIFKLIVMMNAQL